MRVAWSGVRVRVNKREVKTEILMFIHFHFTGPMLSFVDYPELA